MQRGGGSQDGSFGFLGSFPASNGVVQPGSLFSSFFGGTNPFNDPFFTNPSPFDAMMGPSLFQQSMFGHHRSLVGAAANNASGLFQQSMFGSGMFGLQRDLAGAASNAGGFLQHAPEPSRLGGPIIKELSSDDEHDADVNREEKKSNPRKHPRMRKEPYIEEPDEEPQDGKRPKHKQFGRDVVRASTLHSQPQTFMYQSSTVTYPNGACYTSSTTRRAGDNIILEERKEADTTTGKATHRISRGIDNKGHSFTRKRNSDGNVNTMQTLHNMNEDDLVGFEESWQRNAGENLRGWDPRANIFGSGTVHPGGQERHEMLALPAPGQSGGSNFSRTDMHTQNRSNSSRMRMHSQNGPCSSRSGRP